MSPLWRRVSPLRYPRPMATLSVEFEWQPLGSIRLADGLRFPRVDEVPGLYRFAVGDEVYVGETERLGGSP